MSNKAWESMNIALTALSPTEKRLVLTSDSSPSEYEMATYTLIDNFEVEDVLVVIGKTKFVGIIDSDKLNKTRISELINILITNNKTTVVRIITNPISCKVFYPIPKVGTKHIDGNYEYSYCQNFKHDLWETNKGQKGWGIRIIDKSQTDYLSPLTTIQGCPVNNMTHLFFEHPATTLNLIDWDTSNVIDMSEMFYASRAISLDLSSFNTSKVIEMNSMFHNSLATKFTLNSFDTSNVRNMESMFSNIQAKSLDLSGFNTSNVTYMVFMFHGSKILTLDLSGFDTSNVTNMAHMFQSSQITSLDVSGFDTSNVTDMCYMFAFSQTTNLDLSSFDTSKISDMEKIFRHSCVKTLTVKTQSDANRYKKFKVPSNVKIIIAT